MGTLRTVIICALVMATTIAGIGVAPAQNEIDTSRLQRAVGVPGILQHLKELQEIADDNKDTRAAGTRGYAESVDYVASRLKKAGYKVTRQNFTYNRFQENSPAEFERVAPNPVIYTADDFLSMEYSGSGEVTGSLSAVDLLLPPTGGSTSGCEASDFAGFDAGDIALLQRGTCSFRQKVDNAAAAGAAGVVIFNEGNDPGRVDVLGGTLSPPDEEAAVPAVGTSFAVGEELANLLQQGEVEVRIAVDAEVITTKSANVIADTKTGNKDRTIVVGAHLDSVPEGPGINDNGSGTAVVLEIAEQMAKLKIKPENRVRFAFWGAEESGLVGSNIYVNSLSDQEFEQIALNLNFDMLGSPNYARFVYDGDGSDTPDTGAGPDGSGLIEAVFNDFFASQNLQTEPTAFDGRSDYRAFILAGIPAGGLFSGAEDAKSAAQEDIYGGVAGLAYDPCYHQPCDTLKEKLQSDDVEAVEDAYGNNVIVGNVNRLSLGELSDAAAHATLFFAETTDDITDAGARRAGARRQAQMDYIGPFAVR